MTMRKTLNIEIGDYEFEVPISFRVIEIVEAVFDCTADQVISFHLVDASRIKRTLVARTITQWIVELPKGVRRQELYEKCLVCPPEQLTKYAGAIQGSIAYSLEYIDDEQLNMLAAGQDLPGGNETDDDATAKGADVKK